MRVKEGNDVYLAYLWAVKLLDWEQDGGREKHYATCLGGYVYLIDKFMLQ